MVYGVYDEADMLPSDQVKKCLFTIAVSECKTRPPFLSSKSSFKDPARIFLIAGGYSTVKGRRVSLIVDFRHAKNDS
jgi:hypothetical protein